MPAIILVLSTLVMWVAYWFLRMGGLDHLRARRAKRDEDQRRSATQANTKNAPLRAIDDPRDAALVLMLLMARRSGDPTREQIAAIGEAARSVFGFNSELTGRMTQARFIASRAESFEQAAVAFADLFKTRLSREEMAQLVGMISQVAAHDGASDDKAAAIDVLTRRIGLSAAQ